MAQASDMLSFNVDQGASSNVAEASRAAAVLAFLVQPPGKVASLANEVRRLKLILMLACLNLIYVLFWWIWSGSGEPHRQFNPKDQHRSRNHQMYAHNNLQIMSCQCVGHAVIECCLREDEGTGLMKLWTLSGLVGVRWWS